MASQVHCAYCFETLAASFEGRHPLSLAQVEDLWDAYQLSLQTLNPHDSDKDNIPLPDPTISSLRSSHPRDATPGSSSTSTPHSSSSNSSNNSSTVPSTQQSAASSATSLDSATQPPRLEGDFPLFVTWNTTSKNSSHKSLRGCIGTFAPLELEEGLRSYALTSAFNDHRFQPIPASLLPSLSAHVTLLTNFSSPTRDPLAWTLGTHGIRISFTHHHRRLGATYLPDVAPEQGWTMEETMVSLMRKAGWSGSSAAWAKTWKDGKGELVTYEGKQVGLAYAEWQAWRVWVDERP